MRRLARRLLTFSSALSLALCVAVSVLWVRSHRVADVFEGRSTNPSQQSMCLYLVFSSGGKLFVSRGWSHNRVLSHYQYTIAGMRTGWRHWRHRTQVPKKGFAAPTSPGDRRWDGLGLTLIARGVVWTDVQTDYRAALVPFWWLAVTAAVLPGAHLFVLRRGMTRLRLSRTGLCTSCGYDLRATPDRCPECGVAPAA